MSKYHKLSQQPLKLTLVEVKFSTIARMDKYIPDIQDELRHDYPIFQELEERSINVSNDNVTIESPKRWVFIDKAKTCCVELNANRVVFVTSDYDRFDGFLNKVHNILNIINKIINPGLFSRVGLRFCDCVKSLNNQDSDLLELVHPSLIIHDTFNQLGMKALQRQENIIKTQHGFLAIRTKNGVFSENLPDDLINGVITVLPDDQPTLRLMLDFDHFWQDENNQKDFNIDGILTLMSELHESSREAFWMLTTEKAKQVWL
ncbi:TIGR04255 family protein [Aliivibrio kagoshimensis]|uniref:TIGR04255 family protein n=1 Tax=Aliivibrio kagoshimensis TaxID=2910230 RepID=UPI003D0EE59B